MTMQSLVQIAREFLRGRSLSYRRVFTLSNPDAADVLADLAKFCRAHDTTAHPDTHMAARLDGRREVWLRIQNHLRLTDDQLWLLYGGAQGRMANRPPTQE